MLKKNSILAIGSFLLIPIVSVLGAMLFNFINPEIAAGHANYQRNYRILDMTKHIVLWSASLVNIWLWFLTSFFLVKSRKQSYLWLFLTILGPFGFIILTMLRDRAPELGDLQQLFVKKLKIYLRVPYELGFFIIVWVLADQIVVLKRDLMIIYESYMTGISTEEIINQQSASSGMWAFGEGLEEMYLAVLFYLLWPFCFYAMGHLPKLWTSSKKP
jgi:hypothetical protein